MEFLLNGSRRNQNTKYAEQSKVNTIYQQRIYHLRRISQGKSSGFVSDYHKIINRKKDGSQRRKYNCIFDFLHITNGNVQNCQAQYGQHFTYDIKIIGYSSGKKSI